MIILKTCLCVYLKYQVFMHQNDETESCFSLTKYKYMLIQSAQTCLFMYMLHKELKSTHKIHF